jgi:hypothetical protein
MVLPFLLFKFEDFFDIQKHWAYTFINFAGITGMTPKQAVESYLRFAGLFNLPIPLRYAFGIGVSQSNKE